jgi:hypothetical protein
MLDTYVGSPRTGRASRACAPPGEAEIAAADAGTRDDALVELGESKGSDSRFAAGEQLTGLMDERWRVGVTTELAH